MGLNFRKMVRNLIGEVKVAIIKVEARTFSSEEGLRNFVIIEAITIKLLVDF